jgi:hypothetical protein
MRGGNPEGFNEFRQASSILRLLSIRVYRFLRSTGLQPIYPTCRAIWPLSRERHVVVDPHRSFGRPIISGTSITAPKLAQPRLPASRLRPAVCFAFAPLRSICIASSTARPMNLPAARRTRNGCPASDYGSNAFS